MNEVVFVKHCLSLTEKQLLDNVTLMIGANNPFKDNKDPFIPDTVRVRFSDGTDAIDIGATAMNHLEAPLPQIDSSIMQAGDVLTVEFDDEHHETFEVASLHSGSLVFASEDITHAKVALRRRTEIGEIDEEPIALLGSAISPSGRMMMPDTIRVGSHMVTGMGVSTGAIRNFDLNRPDENGGLHPVMLNKNKVRKAESDSFALAKQAFEHMSDLLRSDGYQFGDITPAQVLDNGMIIGGGLDADYTKVSRDLLIHAARQGFGCAVIPQDEIYTYNSKAGTLRGIRNIPTQGILQTMVAEGVTEDIFQEAFIGYRDGSIPDWRYPLTLGSSGVHVLSDFVPIVSYSWLNPPQETPVITVLASGENVSNIFRTPKEKGALFTENMRAHGGEDLIDSLSQTLGIDPSDTNHIYDDLEVDIYPGEEPEPRAPHEYLWQTAENRQAFTHTVRQATTLTHKKDGAVLDVDGYKVFIKTDVALEIDKMVATANRAFGINGAHFIY